MTQELGIRRRDDEREGRMRKQRGEPEMPDIHYCFSTSLVQLGKTGDTRLIELVLNC